MSIDDNKIVEAPYIKFFIAKFMSSPDVAVNMETHEVGAYILLLFTSFLEKKKGYLKNDDEYLRKIIKNLHRSNSQKWVVCPWQRSKII